MASDVAQCYARALQPFRGDFEATALLQEAEQATGMTDWGGKRWNEDRFRADLALFCTALEAEAALTPRGRDRAHSRVHVMLCSRLRYIAWRKAHPAIDREQIVRPLIGTGLPRAGTTFLHNLLAQDPANRSARAWEAAMPAPPPGSAASYASDPRSALYQRILDFQGYGDPALTTIHPFGSDLPEECIFMQEGECDSLYTAFFNVPSFAATRKRGAAYSWQIGQMQLLQSGFAGQRWALKAPGHMFSWEEMFMAFPDARVYVNHRDPAKIVPSIASLFMGLRGLYSDNAAEPAAIGQQQLTGWAAATSALVDWRLEHPQASHVVDVHYLDLIAQPVETVRRIYDAFDIDLAADVIDRIERFLEVDHHGKGPRRTYGLADYGLTEADIESAFGRYIDHFGIGREKRT